MKKLSGFLGFCLALLLPVVAFAQGATPSVQIITGKGTTGPLNPFPTSSIGPSGYVQGVTIANGGARVAQDPTQLLWDDFRGGGGSVPTGTLDTVFNWQTPGQCAPGLVGQVAQPQDANVHAYVMYPRGDRIFWTIDGIDNVVAQTYSGAPGPTNNVMNAAHLAVGNTPLSSALININASVVADAARNPIYNGFIRDRTITSASGASQQLFAANFQRHSLTIVNTGNASCGINPTGGTAAIGGAGTLTLAALGSYTPRIPGRQAITVICTAGQPIYGDEN
jgi:hypothetical protein